MSCDSVAVATAAQSLMQLFGLCSQTTPTSLSVFITSLRHCRL